jgi:hypothetical protein
MSADLLVEKYVEIRDYIKTEDDAHDERLKPYKEGLKALEAALNDVLNVAGAESVKTTAGTAYRSTVMSTKMSDRQAFEQFVQETNRLDFFTAAVAKDQVKEYMDEHGGRAPPGIDISFIHKINVRKS